MNFNLNLIKSSSFFNITCAIVGALGPVAVTLIILVVLGLNPSDFHPYYSDEVHYWNEINSLSNVGFNGGYSVINEVTAKVDESTFGPHGPAFSTILYPYTSVLGWSLLSPLIFNSFFITIALLVWLLFAAEGTLQKVLASSFFITFFPIILFVPTAMQETFHQGLAIFFATSLIYFANKETNFKDAPLSAAHSGILFGAFVLASFVRPSWVLMYALCIVPLIEGFRKRIVQACLSIAAIVLSYGFMYLFFSPTQSEGQLAKLQMALIGQSAHLESFLSVAGENALRFFDWEIDSAFPASLLRYEMLLVLSACTFTLLVRKNLIENERRKIILAWLILFSSILSVVLLYEVGGWRDYRTLVPGFIVASLILVSVRSFSRLMIVVIIIQIISFAKCVETFDLYRRDNFSSLPKVAKIKSVLTGVIAFDSKLPAWCNTLLIFTPGQEDSLLVALSLDPGIGMSVVHKIDTLKRPLKSKYVLLNAVGKEKFRQFGLFNAALNEVASLNEIGAVFLNTNSVCN